MTDLCELPRTGEAGLECKTCDKRIGFFGVGDCPRRRKARRGSGAVDPAAVARPSGSAGVVARHRVGGR